MNKGCFVKDIAGPNLRVQGLFVLTQASQGQAKNGPYWRLSLLDRTGTLDAKIWSPKSAEYSGFTTGSYVEVQGESNAFQGNLQLSVNEVRVLSPDEVAGLSMTDFLPSGPHDPDTLYAQAIEQCRQEFVHAPWRTFALSVLEDADIAPAFRNSPAAKFMHHAYVGGLMEHSLGVFNLCRRICDHYPWLDRQTLLAGALFHDIGKIREISCEPGFGYTDEGSLLGHLEMGVEMLGPFMARAGLDAPLAQHLKHLVLSHHGQYEFAAVRLPQTAEALALHHADDLDAKMAQSLGLLRQLEERGQQWSAPREWIMDRPMFRPGRTPECAPAPTQPVQVVADAPAVTQAEAAQAGDAQDDAAQKGRGRKVVKERCLSLLKV